MLGDRRRAPVQRQRYRAVARSAGLAPRLRRPFGPLHLALLFAAVAFLLVVTPVLGDVVVAGVDQVGAGLDGILAPNAGTGTIELPAGGGTVAAQPIADGLPDYTRDPHLALAGRVPAFALGDGSGVTGTGNGKLLDTIALDATGTFKDTLTLSEGANTIELALTSRADVIAKTTYHVVLDRQPPALAITKPADGDAVEGTSVAVQGKTEPGTSVVVNGRTVVVDLDGTFSETVTATGANLSLEITARDRAGNETTKKLAVTTKPTPAPTVQSDLSVQLNIDRPRVAPGATVNAYVIVLANSVARPNEVVTVSVGGITVGSAQTDAAGLARVTFAAPSTEGDLSVVVLVSGTSARATLTVAR